MKAEYINPFIQSVSEVFENMLQCTVEMGSVGIAAARKGPQDIIGVIDLSGTANGSVAVRFPIKTALAVVGKMIDTEFETVDSSVIDGVGELVNVVAGNAKAKLEGHSLSVSLPTVVRGDVYCLSNSRDIVWLELPFSSPLGDFTLAVSFKPSPMAHKEAIHEGVVGG